MKKYKHKVTGETVEQKGDYYTADGKSLKKEWVENSCDWEEVVEEKYFQQFGRFNCVGKVLFKEGDTFIRKSDKETTYTLKEVRKEGAIVSWFKSGEEFTFDFPLETVEDFLKNGVWILQKEFRLPKNWYVVVTEENRDLLSKWRFDDNENKLDVGDNCGIVKTPHRFTKAHSSSGCIKDLDGLWSYDFGQEITFEQFKKHVLGGKLITTEDGVDVYEGDSVHWVSLRKSIYLYEAKFTKHRLQLDFNKFYKVFSTKEEAKSWLVRNTRCLTFKEATEYSHTKLLNLATIRNIK
jgi:hypothetical protein